MARKRTRRSPPVFSGTGHAAFKGQVLLRPVRPLGSASTRSCGTVRLVNVSARVREDGARRLRSEDESGQGGSTGALPVSALWRCSCLPERVSTARGGLGGGRSGPG